MPDAPLQTVQFQCIACRVKLQVSTAKIGTQQRCPHCQAKLVVPSLAGQSAAPSLQDDYELWEGTHQPASDARWALGPFITIACRVCGTRLTATLDQVGSTLACPDCRCGNLVPPPVEQELPKRQILLEEGEPLEVEAPVEVAAIEPLITSTRLLEPAEEDAHSTEITRPLSSGIWSFPFQLQTLILVLVLALGLVVTVGIFSFATVMMGGVAPGIGSLGAVGGVCFLAIGSMAALLWASATAACLLAICTDTALGHQKLVSWPEDGPVEWLIELFQLSICLIGALVPGYTIMLLANVSGLGVLIPLGASMACLFPILLLSTLESGSFFGFVSPAIWRSLRLKRAAWIWFYLQSSVLVALLMGLGVFLISQSLLGVLVCAVFVVAALVIYFRLLGRLAWVCSDIVLPKSSATAEREESWA